ncbi:MAG: glycosyltransferase family 1 protein [Microbacterium sp.]|nr:glycosyltransferase family 1 protein [Microbacterium sp.]MBA4346836.1 glycosyltransferase family 1 protein [Microbacterium sp.]
MSLTTLRVVLDQVGDPVPSGIGRYALELTRALIETAPRGCDVAGIVASSPASEYERIEQQLPGLSDLFKSALDRRQLAAAWQHGFTRLPGAGMVHAPSLFAPLYRHDRINSPGEQTVVTIHHSAAFTHPETLPSRTVAWTRAMAKRAERYADAIVVPTHAVADDLTSALDLGDRVRVIAAAVSPSLDPGPSRDSQAAALDLPERYVLAVGGLDGVSGIPALVRAAAGPHAPEVPLLLVGVSDDELDTLMRDLDAPLDRSRVRALGVLGETALAVAYSRATVVAVPAISAGSGLVALEAMSLGAPVVHSDTPALLEVCSDAGVVVARDDAEGYPERLAEAVRSVLDDSALAAELTVRGRDRARAFSWRDSAEKTWQLHADL